MLKTIPAVPAKTVEVCDFCGYYHKPYYECELCGRRVCWPCLVPIMLGSIHTPRLCRPCARRKDAIRIVAQYAPRFEAACKCRARALRRLQK